MSLEHSPQQNSPMHSITSSAAEKTPSLIKHNSAEVTDMNTTSGNNCRMRRDICLQSAEDSQGDEQPPVSQSHNEHSSVREMKGLLANFVNESDLERNTGKQASSKLLEPRSPLAQLGSTAYNKDGKERGWDESLEEEGRHTKKASKQNPHEQTVSDRIRATTGKEGRKRRSREKSTPHKLEPNSKKAPLEIISKCKGKGGKEV